MELPSKLLEQIAFNKRPKIEEHVLIVMDKSTHEENLYPPLQTNKKQFKIAVSFLTGNNGIFSVTNSNNRFYFKKTISKEEDFIQITIPPGAHEIKSINIEIKRINIDKGYYTEPFYPFTRKSNFSKFGSNIEKSLQGPIIGFVFDDSSRNLLGFIETILHKEYNLSPNPVDILSFDNIFLECDIAEGMISKGKRSGIIRNWTMTVDPGYKNTEKFSGI